MISGCGTVGGSGAESSNVKSKEYGPEPYVQYSQLLGSGTSV